MKRSDIKPGEAYYYDQSNDWADRGHGRRAVVVDGERYRIRKVSFGFRYESNYLVDPKGNAVLVDLYYSNDCPTREAVPVAHLRGPWEATKSDVERNRDAKLARKKAAQDRENNLRERSAAAVARAAAAEIKADVINECVRDVETREYVRTVEIRLTVPEFERLLDLTGR
jgi:hypothetical protein